MGQPEEPISPIERRLYGLDRSPPPPGLAELGRAMVNHSRLTFKLFRRDFEAVGKTISAATQAGELTRQQAADLFLDLGDVVSLPIAEAYLERGECVKLADWLRARPGFGELEWLRPRNRVAIEGLIAHNEAALAIALLRQHLHKAMTQTRTRWRFAANVLKAMKEGKQPPQSGREVLERMPAELDLMLYEIDECEAYVAFHGATSDISSLDDQRAEIARARKRLPG